MQKRIRFTKDELAVLLEALCLTCPEHQFNHAPGFERWTQQKCERVYNSFNRKVIALYNKKKK